MITRLWDQVQLSLYSTRALFQKYFVVMKYRRICKIYNFERKSIFKHIYY